MWASNCVVRLCVALVRRRERELEKWDARNANASRVKVVTDALGHFWIGVFSPVSGALRISYNNMTDLSQGLPTKSTKQHADVAPMLKLGAFYGLYITLSASMTLNPILRAPRSVLLNEDEEMEDSNVPSSGRDSMLLYIVHDFFVLDITCCVEAVFALSLLITSLTLPHPCSQSSMLTCSSHAPSSLPTLAFLSFLSKSTALAAKLSCTSVKNAATLPVEIRL